LFFFLINDIWLSFLWTLCNQQSTPLLMTLQPETWIMLRNRMIDLSGGVKGLAICTTISTVRDGRTCTVFPYQYAH